MASELIKRTQRFIFYPILGKTYLQWFWRPLRMLATKGMNFGNGSVFEQSGEMEVIRRVVTKSAPGNRALEIFDVGANAGHYSLAVAKQFIDYMGQLNIRAFEPSPSIFKQLQQNTSQHRNITPYNLGFSSTSGTGTLFFNQDYSVTSSLHRGNLVNFGLNVDAEESVHLDTIDQFCTEHNVAEIDFLKLDVEGHELEVLKGASTMLKEKRIKTIQFEIGRTNIDSRTYFRDYFDLLNPTFRIYRILKNGLFRVKEYNEMDEVFVTTNYLAELRG